MIEAGQFRIIESVRTKASFRYQIDFIVYT